MPIERPQGDAEAPADEKGNRVAHIGVVADQSGRLKGLGPGHPFLIIEDPTDKMKIFPLTIVEVSHKKLVFKCRCSQPGCTRRVVFKAKWDGRHPIQTG